jgi:hypothetical protein
VYRGGLLWIVTAAKEPYRPTRNSAIPDVAAGSVTMSKYVNGRGEGDTVWYAAWMVFLLVASQG